MTKEEKNEYAKWYRKKNVEKIREKEAIVREINREFLRVRAKKYQETHKQQRIVYSKNKKTKCLLSWNGIIPNKTNCEICGKEIILASGIQENSIHFDHKMPNLPIKRNPSVWLSSHMANENNIKLWEDCDFGMLCRKCNLHLPTDNRKDFIIKVIKYMNL